MQQFDLAAVANLPKTAFISTRLGALYVHTLLADIVMLRIVLA